MESSEPPAGVPTAEGGAAGKKQQPLMHAVVPGALETTRGAGGGGEGAWRDAAAEAGKAMGMIHPGALLGRGRQRVQELCLLARRRNEGTTAGGN
jgi:hypothetical protein